MVLIRLGQKSVLTNFTALNNVIREIISNYKIFENSEFLKLLTSGQHFRYKCQVLHSSVGKEFACNAGDHSLIPQLGRSPREGNRNPFQ